MAAMYGLGKRKHQPGFPGTVQTRSPPNRKLPPVYQVQIRSKPATVAPCPIPSAEGKVAVDLDAESGGPLRAERRQADPPAS
jgi:hypothetical protein